VEVSARQQWLFSPWRPLEAAEQQVAFCESLGDTRPHPFLPPTRIALLSFRLSGAE
jgi:hypothetical protein